MKTKIQLLLTLIIFFVSGQLYAQAGYQDVIYLKNGSVIHGIIIEQVPNESVKIEMKDKSVFVFKMDEVDKITKEKVSKFGRNKMGESPAIPDKGPYTGYSLSVEGYIGPGINNKYKDKFNIAAHVINGVTVKSLFSIGAGIGFDGLIDYYKDNNSYQYYPYPPYPNNYNYINHSYLAMAFFLDLKAFPVQGKITPLFIFDYGYTACIFTDNIQGGAMLNAGVGAKLRLSPKKGISISVNYKNQKMTHGENIFKSIVGNTSGTSGAKNPFNLQYLCFTFGASF